MAANTRDIRRRIKSIKNTAQITKAMQMVAAAKMRKAQTAALAGRPYSELINRVLVDLEKRTDVTLHPLLEEREVKRELVLVVSTDGKDEWGTVGVSDNIIEASWQALVDSFEYRLGK